MTKTEFIKKLESNLTGCYKFQVVRIDEDLKHAEILVTDNGHGIAYMNVSYEGDKLSVFRGAILNLPCQFIRVHERIEK